MGGKAILLVILGLSTTLVFVTLNYNRLSTIAAENSIEYVEYAVLQNVAESGANMASNEVFRNPTWTAGFQNVIMETCTLNVNVQVLDAALNIRRINSVATKTIETSLGRRSASRTVQVTLQPSNFSKFAYYSSNEGGSINWATGDTVWGPFHTQDNMRINGNPYFVNHVTLKGTITKNSSSDKPTFVEGYETGVDLPINEDAIAALAIDAGTAGFTFPETFTYKKSNKTYTADVDTVYIKFAGDYIQYKYRYQDSYTSVAASSFSNNGVIFAGNAVVRLQGTVKGKFTLACSGSSSSGKGDIYLDDDIVYYADPVANPSSTDILGIVAQNDVIITNNTANKSDININASIYCQNGGFGAEKYDTRGKCGNINLVGGIIQKTRAAVGTIGSGGSISNGFNKRYRYDTRFMFKAPPKYPNTGSYEILSWYE
jgi:hypothetical protein